jgi:hypothetical protein
VAVTVSCRLIIMMLRAGYRTHPPGPFRVGLGRASINAAAAAGGGRSESAAAAACRVESRVLDAAPNLNL